MGEAQGREGLTMHCGTECSYGCIGKGGGDYFEWMFFRQRKEENPGEEEGCVEGTVANEGHFF